VTNAALSELLAEHGLAAVEVPGTDGGAILALNAGARTLRLTGESGHDFLWMNSALLEGRMVEEDPATGWRNFGGDRTWISPESDIMIEDLGDPWRTYRMPPSFDPGHYEVSRDGSGVRLSNRCVVRNHRLNAEAEIAVDKTIAAILNPLRTSDAGRLLVSAEYIGCEQTTTLSLLSKPVRGMRFGLWHLTQLRSPAEVLVPISEPTRPHTYFGQADTTQMSVEERLVRFRVDGTELRKIGLKADAVTGRMGFVQELADGSWSLVVRNIIVNPSAEYVDTPWDDLEDTGYAVQCFSNSGPDDFAELEYHTPAIGDGTGTSSYTDRSQLWAFRAEQPIIQRIARRLLAVDIQECCS